MNKEKIESLINSNIDLQLYKVKSWTHSIVNTQELISKYEIRADWFEKNKGYRSIFFQKIIDTLSTLKNNFVYMISFEFEDDIGFALFDESKLLFFSGPMKSW